MQPRDNIQTRCSDERRVFEYLQNGDLSFTNGQTAKALFNYEQALTLYRSMYSNGSDTEAYILKLKISGACP